MESNSHSIDSSTAAQGTGSNGIPVSGYAAQYVRPLGKRGLSPAAWLVAGLAALVICGVAAGTVWFVGLGSMFDKLASVQLGPQRTESKTIPQGVAASVAVNVNMGQGTLTLAGGATDLLEANFSYNVDAWKPQVAYRETLEAGTLTVEQPRSEGFVRTPDGVRNEWSLHLKDGVPLTLTANLGAGSATIKTDGLLVSKLSVVTGASESVLDLTGKWKQSVDVTVQSGAGDTTIRLPKGVGARVKIESGVSNVDGGGMTRAGNTYTNAAYGKTPVTIEVTIKTGVGDVKLEPDR